MLKLLKSYFLIALFASSTLIASSVEHSPVGIRSLPAEVIAEKEAEAATQTCATEELSEAATRATSNGFLFPGNGYSYAEHYIHGISYYGEQVELEDGSVWKVNCCDRYKVSAWDGRDPITITQNTSWFSSYNYRLINQFTGSSVEANLYLGPVVNGIYTHYINWIDYCGAVILTDGSQWQISSRDLSVFRCWAYDDTIIIGTNSGWDGSYNAILINVTMNNYVRAYQY
jgi:hypothetical protein